MSKVHYFQRYNQKENVVTNNTLLLLSRLYSRSPLYLEAFLNDLAEESDIEVGVGFTQQNPSSGGSVTDGLLVQRSLKVAVETKVVPNASLDQLEKHLKAFDGEDTQILLLLAPSEPNNAFRESLDRAVRDHNARHEGEVLHVCTTFGRILQSFEGALPSHDYEMQELLEDYKDFCAGEGLLPREEYRMRAVPCGRTIEENSALGVYYQPASRPYRAHKYIGLYKHKRVQYVGELEAIIAADLTQDGPRRVDGSTPPTPEQRSRIEYAMRSAREIHGSDITRNYRFFLVDRFYPTDFRKASSGGMMNHRYFDLGEILGTDDLPETEEIATRLSGKEW